MREKIGLIALFISTYLVSFSQLKEPVLLSDSNSVTIKIDGNMVAVWNIDPDTKPWTDRMFARSTDPSKNNMLPT